MILDLGPRKAGSGGETELTSTVNLTIDSMANTRFVVYTDVNGNIRKETGIIPTQLVVKGPFVVYGKPMLSGYYAVADQLVNMTYLALKDAAGENYLYMVPTDKIASARVVQDKNAGSIM